jgi:hypothetical protein
MYWVHPGSLSLGAPDFPLYTTPVTFKAIQKQSSFRDFGVLGNLLFPECYNYNYNYSYNYVYNTNHPTNAESKLLVF